MYIVLCTYKCILAKKAFSGSVVFELLCWEYVGGSFKTSKIDKKLAVNTYADFFLRQSNAEF